MNFTTTRQLLDVLRQERILPATALLEAEQLSAQIAEPHPLIQQLAQRGLLTSYQAKVLLHGQAGDLILKDYVLLEPLGEGGMGKVYKARHRVMDRLVAIKTIRPEAMRFPQAAQRFEREIQVATKVDHPNIVRALDAGRWDDGHFFAMEFVDGIDLARLVDEEGPLPIPLACDFVRQAALGLQHIHERGGVHRDIKPQNLVASFSRVKGDLKDARTYEAVKILDLGLAILRPHEAHGKTMMGLTSAGSVMGTPDYMAPEQTTDTHTVDIRADLYSLGCTLYYLLTGHVLFAAGSVAQKLFQHRMVPAPDVRQQRPEVPAGLEAVLQKLLEKKKEERYGTPGEVAEALAGYCASVPAVRRDAVLATVPRRWAWVLAGASMFGIGLMALLFSFLNRGPSEPSKSVKIITELPLRIEEPPKHKPPAKIIFNSLKMKLVWIEPGRFQMGSPLGEKDRSDNELRHEVEITQGFYMGAFEVTQQQYRRVMGSNPSFFNAALVGQNTDDFPVEYVSWGDAMDFCRRLTDQEKDTGRVYDLPTEAEWEYACRAGTKSVFAFGDALDSTQANFYGDYPYGGAAKGPYLKRTTTVGAYEANAWGLYDMHGNVWEWCKDWHGKDYYHESAGKDPQGPAKGIGRVLRGGVWYLNARYCRSAQRDLDAPVIRDNNIGFRVVVRLSPRTP